MLVKFILRTPGQHQEIAESKMDLVPREGETVTIGEITRTVHSVGWNIDGKTVYVYLDE